MWPILRIILGFVVSAFGMYLGLYMAVWPAWFSLKNRDQGDTRPPTVGEVWTTRVTGILFVIGCGCGLYAIVTGVPGAEFGAP